MPTKTLPLRHDLSGREAHTFLSLLGQLQDLFWIHYGDEIARKYQAHTYNDAPCLRTDNTAGDDAGDIVETHQNNATFATQADRDDLVCGDFDPRQCHLDFDDPLPF